MRQFKIVNSTLIMATAVLCAGARLPLATVAESAAAPSSRLGASETQTAAASNSTVTTPMAAASVAPVSVVVATNAAVAALRAVVQPLSDSRALVDAFHSYYVYKATHGAEVKKPYLYFVDYGLPSTARRGWVLDMSLLKAVDGPFTVAHGRGSSTGGATMATRFSNALGSASTSLGLYVARGLYPFEGRSGGQIYHSVGLRLDGVSTGFNDNAAERRVVVHGAPYVTPVKAGRSEGCPAMEPSRARRLLPELADGGMVFLFAPDAHWLSTDPWLAAN